MDQQTSFLRRSLKALGLDRKELRAWALYDWGNSAFATTIMATVLPIYYADVAAVQLEEHVRTAYWGYTAATALLLVTVLSPLLGAMADFLGAKKKFLALFLAFGIFGSAALYFVGQGDYLLASIFFIIGNIGFAAGNVFYESLLPHITDHEQIDRVSTAGYALGYFGGGLLLVINFAWIEMPEFFGFGSKSLAVRASFVSVAVWWLVFSLPLFFHVREPAYARPSTKVNAIPHAFKTLWLTFKKIRNYKYVMMFLAAFWLYSDGIGTIIKMATVYGREIGIGTGTIMGAFVLVQFLGVPFTFLFAPVTEAFGIKPAILFTLIWYMGICVLGYFMTEAWHFWALATAVAVVQGACQALSRSLYASIIPKHQSSEFFSFYSVSSKFAGIFGPLIFGLLAQSLGGSRFSILFLILFFAVGFWLLARLDLVEARRLARQAEI